LEGKGSLNSPPERTSSSSQAPAWDMTADSSAPASCPDPGAIGARPPEVRGTEVHARHAGRSRVWLAGLALEAVLVSLIWVGVFLRFHGDDWSQGANLHPDEYGLANTLSQLALPRSIGEYFNTRLSPLSPYQKYDGNGQPAAAGADNRMRWGQWPITIIRCAAEEAGLTGYGELVRLGRRLSALADCLTLLFLLLIGCRLYGRRIALLATALSAMAVMPIQQSHFMTVDTFAALFTVAAIYCAVRAAQGGREVGAVPVAASPQDEGRVRRPAEDWKWYALFGIAAGMAVASRINLILLLGVIPLSAVIAVSGEWQKQASGRSSIVTGSTLRIALSVMVALAVFRATQPMAIRAESGETAFLTIRPNPDWVASMKLAAAESNLEAGGPPAEQWTGRPRLIFPLINMVVWGMGLPLGLAACTGLVWALWRFFYGDDWRTHFLPLAWSGGYFVFMGTRHVMSMRYLLPIYPLMALLAAWALAEMWKKSEAVASHEGAVLRPGRSLPRLVRTVVTSITVTVVLGTLAWAIAFTSVYRRPNTRIEASRWIYENVAAGTTLANESWDEPLPVPLDGRDPFGGFYRGLTMEVRWPDSEAKRRMFLDNLSGSDYIVLSSQRALWSISRIPNTYPMTMEYYRALFEGRLGFDVAAQFHRTFSIGPLRLSDLVGKGAWKQDPAVPVSSAEPFTAGLLAAEEAFSVYDHAPVWIFRKRDDFDSEKARSVLQAADLTRVVVQGPREAAAAPTLLMLPSDRLMEQRAGGTWSEMFNPEGILNRHPLVGVMAWYGALLLAGWLAFPLAFLALGGLPDRGYPLAKTMALLLVAWAVWILGSYRLMPFTRATIIMAVLALAIPSCLILYLRRAELANYLRRNVHYVLVVETLFLALFVAQLMIRLGNPDLWHPTFGGEKPMVFSYFNAVLKSTSFPPYDPWLSGGYINYYYYGFVVAGQMVKLLGLVPSFAYNLIIPTLFALLGTSVFCIAYNLVRAQAEAEEQTAAGEQATGSRTTVHGSTDVTSGLDPASAGGRRFPSPYFAGIASLLLATVLGNLAQVKVLAAGLQHASGHPVQAASDLDWAAVLAGAGRALFGGAEIPIGLGNWYWDATRTIATTTGGSEINEFPSFTFLYGDMHAHMLDMPLAMLALAWAVACVTERRRKRCALEAGLVWLSGALIVGATRITNMWDFPTCLALSWVAILAAQWWHSPSFTRASLASALGRMLLLTGLIFLLYRPFDRWFASPLSGLDVWNGARTQLEPYLSSHGLFLFLVVTLLVCETVHWLAETPASVLSEPGKWLPPALLGACVFSICIGVLLAKQVAPALVGVPIIAWSTLLLFRSRARLRLEKRSVLFLLGTGIALTLFVELFAVGGDRTNTLFKLYLQAWLLLAVAAGPALAWIWSEKISWTPGWNRGWTGGLCLLAVLAALYPVTATCAKIRDRFPPARAATNDPASDCKLIPGVQSPDLPNESLPVACQPHGLDGLAYMRWSAYCENGYFVPLKYDYEAIRWMQKHVPGSPVIAEAQSFNLYRMSGRYSWNTGLPDVVGWDWHQRQQRAAISTQFITDRGHEVTRFFADDRSDQAAAFIRKYKVRYIIVGPLERALYSASGGLEKFETMVAQGLLAVVYRNPGVVIYQESE
jgi:YYY domain-containing protein